MIASIQRISLALFVVGVVLFGGGLIAGSTVCTGISSCSAAIGSLYSFDFSAPPAQSTPAYVAPASTTFFDFTSLAATAQIVGLYLIIGTFLAMAVIEVFTDSPMILPSKKRRRYAR